MQAGGSEKKGKKDGSGTEDRDVMTFYSKQNFYKGIS